MRLLDDDRYKEVIKHPDIKETIKIVLERMKSEIENGFA